MLVYFVCEELFSPYKVDTLAYDRFVNLLQERDVDALLIANTSDQFHREIDAFKHEHGSLVSRVVESETPIRMANKLFHLRASSLVTPKKEVIHAVDDTICELVVKEDGTYEYQYIALDLFDSELFDQVNASKPVKQIVIPFQDILAFLEQNMDEETAELLKKAKADFYYKTKS